MRPVAFLPAADTAFVDTSRGEIGAREPTQLIAGAEIRSVPSTVRIESIYFVRSLFALKSDGNNILRIGCFVKVG